jgi:uncharacterized protein (DUF1778 family)
MTLSGELWYVDFEGGHMAQRTNRTEKLDLRLTPAAKDTLRLAAESSRETVSDFVLKSALARADEILADRRVIKMNDEQWKAFMAALDAPPKPRPRLKRLLSEPSILD